MTKPLIVYEQLSCKTSYFPGDWENLEKITQFFSEEALVRYMIGRSYSEEVSLV